MIRFLQRVSRRFATCSTIGVGVVSLIGVAQAQAVATGSGIQGMWWPLDPTTDVRPLGGPISYTAAGAAALAKNAATIKAAVGKPKERDDLSACLPAGPIRILQQPYPLQVIQKGQMVVLIYEHNHVFEIVYVADPPGEAEKADPSYMGYSSGTWSKGELVVTTSNFNDQTMLSEMGVPHSDKLSVTRRIRTSNAGSRLEVVSTITDPVMFRRPWSVRQVLESRPDAHIEEYVCGQGTFETRYTRQGATQ